MDSQCVRQKTFGNLPTASNEHTWWGTGVAFLGGEDKGGGTEGTQPIVKR